MLTIVRSYKLGDPQDETTTTGPVISALAMVKIQSHIDDALSKGAVNSTPENVSFGLANTALKGNFLAPIVLTNVNHDMITMKEETFGPVMPIMKVSSDEEAIALMNDTDYGLTASVWTKDLAKGEEIIDQVEAGTVFLNRCDYPAPVSTPIRSDSPACCLVQQLTHFLGPGMDRLEVLWSGMHPRTPSLRWFHQAEELPHQECVIEAVRKQLTRIISAKNHMYITNAKMNRCP